MKIENLREVKTRFSRYIKGLSKTSSAVINKKEPALRPLVPVTEDTDLEDLVLSPVTIVVGAKGSRSTALQPTALGLANRQLQVHRLAAIRD